MPGPRFLLLADVAEVLNISANQAYALVRNGDLKAIKVGGRGAWRVERDQLEAYIARQYRTTAEYVTANPLRADEEPSLDEDRPARPNADRPA